MKRLFGAGRELAEEGTGSLTVIATVLDADDRGAEVREALETTENLLLRLDADLAAKGIVPVAGGRRHAGASGEDELRDPGGAGEGARGCARSSSEMDPEEAAQRLGERIASDLRQRRAARRVELGAVAAAVGDARPRRARRRARSARSRGRAGRSRRSGSTRRRRCRARPP